MIKASDAVRYFENLYANHAVYLWGANGEKITPELCDRLYKNFGSGTYTKNYYNNKLKYGQGRIGADCSGSMYPISGFDDTAQGYYNRCPVRGNISQIPKDKPCLVFKGKNDKKITHIGFYCGNGNVIEMKSSKDDCVKRPLKAGDWKFYGIPSWISYDTAQDGSDVVKPTLRRGDHNDYVLHWQKYLSLLGFYKGEIDGIFGPATEKAVKEWQSSAGLKPDGIIGPKSWAALGL